jgi:hypothetical protein
MIKLNGLYYHIIRIQSNFLTNNQDKIEWFIYYHIIRIQSNFLTNNQDKIDTKFYYTETIIIKSKCN